MMRATAPRAHAVWTAAGCLALALLAPRGGRLFVLSGVSGAVAHVRRLGGPGETSLAVGDLVGGASPELVVLSRPDSGPSLFRALSVQNDGETRQETRVPAAADGVEPTGPGRH